MNSEDEPDPDLDAHDPDRTPLLTVVDIENANDPCPYRMPCGRHQCDTPHGCPDRFIPPCETGLPPLSKQDNASALV